MFLCLQLFILTSIEASSGQDRSLEMSSNEIDGIELYKYVYQDFIASGCQWKSSDFRYFDIRLAHTWFAFPDWLQKCLISFSKSSCSSAAVWEKIYNDTSFLRKCQTFRILVLNLEEMKGLLTSIESIEDATEQFFEAYKCATDSVKLNYSVISNSTCYDSNYIKFVTKTSNEFNEIYKTINQAYKYQKNIQLSLSIIVAILGLIMNGIFWFSFVFAHELTYETKAILFIIAICDCISLVVVFPLEHIIVTGIDYSDQLIRVYVFIILLLSSSRGICVLALSIQRLLMITREPQRTCCSRINNCSRTVLCALLIWGSSAALTTLISMIYWIDYFYFIFQTILVTAIMINLFLFSLPITVCVLNIVSSRKLKQISRSTTGDSSNSGQKRYISSKAVTFLCGIFWFTHAPMICMSLILMSEIRNLITYNWNVKLLSFSIHIIFYLSASFNPLTQNFVRRNLRELWARYFLRKKDNIQ